MGQSPLSRKFFIVAALLSCLACASKEESSDNFIIKAIDLEMIEFIATKEDSRFVARELEQNEERERALEFKMVRAGNSYAGSLLNYSRKDETAVIDDAAFQLTNSSLSGAKVYYDGRKSLLSADEALITGTNYQLQGKNFVYHLDRNDFRFNDGGSGQWSKED